MVNVEADALAAPARPQGQGRGRRLQPRLGRPAGADLRARRLGARLRLQGDRGRQRHPLRAALSPSNPDNVWDILDKYLNISDRKSINPKMFNSFVDGTKSGIEMTAVCNATGLCRRPRAWAFRRRRASSWPTSASRKRGRHAGKGRRHRSHFFRLSRRQGRAASSRARHLRGDRGRDRIRAPLLQGIRHAAGPQRPLCRALSPDPHDRARARHLGRERGAAP